MISRTWRWVMAVLVVVAIGVWSSDRARACGGIGLLAINCDGIIIANQITQIGHMVTQIGRMASQLQSLDGIMALSDELVTSDDPGMGNLGRVREVFDLQFDLSRNGIGLTTDATGEGAFSQRLPGLSDVDGWLEFLSAPETRMLATRPATEILGAEPGVFDTWALPDEGQALAVLAELEAMGSGTTSYQTAWGTMAAGTPALLTEAEWRAATENPARQARLIAAAERELLITSADLVHTHAAVEAASVLAAQAGEAAAAQADLRGDDLMRPERVRQAQLAAAATETELVIAQAQLAAYLAAREARQRYEEERARREAQARWQADAVRERAAENVWSGELSGIGAALADSHRFQPSVTW